MVRVAALFVITLIACASCAPARAEDSMRCGSRLVSVGDGKDKVRALCGEPTDIAFAGIVGRRGFPDYAHGDAYDYSFYGPVWLEMPVEIWTYNFGAHKLLRKLRFIGDQLVEIDTAGYGY